MNKRYYTNENTTIDLEEVVGIRSHGEVTSSRERGNKYEVAFKAGTILFCIGYNLRSQFAEYKGLTEEETKE